MVILGVMTQGFFLFGLLLFLFLSHVDNGGVDVWNVVPITLSNLLFISTYLVGEFADEAFSFSGWCYLFVCTLIGAVNAVILCLKNEMTRGQTNMLSMILVFTNLVTITTTFNKSTEGCFGSMAFAVVVSMIPFFVAINFYKTSISSFDTRIKTNRVRLIAFIVVWQARLVVVWTNMRCGYTKQSSEAAFWHVILDITWLSISSDIFWNSS